MRKTGDAFLVGDLIAWTPLAGLVRKKRYEAVTERSKVESIRLRIAPLLRSIYLNHSDLIRPAW